MMTSITGNSLTPAGGIPSASGTRRLWERRRPAGDSSQFSPREKERGFTLIEVMLAVSILALGTVMVQQGFLRCAGLFAEATHRLAAETWANSKLAETREKVYYVEPPDFSEESGVFEVSGRSYDWRVTISSLPAGRDLYQMLINVNWQESGRPKMLSKESYVTLRPKIQ